MRKEIGHTLVELLFVMVIGLIMIIAAGAITGIGKKAHNRIMGESNIYNDIAYSFKLIQRRVHGTGILATVTPVDNSWVGKRLVTGSEAFGVYTHAGGHDFVHLPNKYNLDDRRVLLSVPVEDSLNAVYNVTSDVVDINLSGTRNKIPFNMTAKIKSRR